jgi:hypothetical protein
VVRLAFGDGCGYELGRTMQETPLNELTAGRFAALVRTAFRVTAEPGPEADLTLVSVTARRIGGPETVSAESPDAASFALLFDGPVGQPLAQRTYRFQHDTLGSFDLFIVPVGADRGRRQYEAVFNRR